MITQEEFQKLPREEQRRRWEELLDSMPDKHVAMLYRQLFPPDSAVDVTGTSKGAGR